MTLGEHGFGVEQVFTPERMVRSSMAVDGEEASEVERALQLGCIEGIGVASSYLL
ncbi:MAG: hypothetical protein HC765_16045 [Brachymonas sp.]|nr:hypothetical protein [Brachymonas sp.]